MLIAITDAVGTLPIFLHLYHFNAHWPDFWLTAPAFRCLKIFLAYRSLCCPWSNASWEQPNQWHTPAPSPFGVGKSKGCVYMVFAGSTSGVQLSCAGWKLAWNTPFISYLPFSISLPHSFYLPNKLLALEFFSFFFFLRRLRAPRLSMLSLLTPDFSPVPFSQFFSAGVIHVKR